MQNPNNSVTELATPIESNEPTDAIEQARQEWHAQVSQMMTQAAALCIAHGIDIDTYMGGAWSAYVEARPGMRAQLEEAQLRVQIDELRKLGRMASA